MNSKFQPKTKNFLFSFNLNKKQTIAFFKIFKKK